MYIFIDPIDVDYTHKIFDGRTLIKGTIRSIDESISIIICDDVKKRLFGGTKAKPSDVKQDRTFSLVRWMDETTHKIQSDALEKFANGGLANQNISEIIVNGFNPWKTKSENIQKFFLNLNDYQKECVNKSFENNDIFLIHGPPGTGKTKVCSEIVAQQLVANPESKIMVCADSNQAVDNILENVATLLPPEFHIKLLRVGAPEKIKESTTKFLLKHQAYNHPLRFYIEQLSNENKSLTKKNTCKRIPILDINEIKELESLVKLLKNRAIDDKPNAAIFITDSIKNNETLHQKYLQFFNFIKCDYDAVDEDSTDFSVKAIDDTLKTFIQFSKDKWKLKKDLDSKLANLLSEINKLKRTINQERVSKLKCEHECTVRLYNLLFNSETERIQRLNENNAKINEIKKQIYYEILLGANIIFCTNTYAGQKLITKTLNAKDFDLVIIDEATQGTEFSTLIPLMKAEKVILAGDYRQLPPTLALKNMKGANKTEQKLINESIKILETTLFEKLIRQFEQNSPDSMYRLKIQYRMNDSIIGFINKHFYGDVIRSDESCCNRITQKSLVLINTETIERKVGTSFINDGEADIVHRLISRFKRVGHDNLHEIGVITPYTAQVDLINRKLKEFGINAKTVDGFQGQEKDIIIVSLVRSDTYKHKVKSEGQLEEYLHRTGVKYNEFRRTIGFLSDMRRLNVMITRFRKKLILIGNTETLSRFEQDPENPNSSILYKDLFEYIRDHERGLYIKSYSELDNSVNNALITESAECFTKPPSIFSNNCPDLRDAIINSIKTKYTFELLVKKYEKNKNLFLQKYYSDKVDYGSYVKIDIQDSIKDNLKNDNGAWNYKDEKEKRQKVLEGSIKENGKLVVTGVLNLLQNLTPLNTDIKKSLKEDIEWIAGSMNSLSAVKPIKHVKKEITIDSEKVEKHSKKIKYQLTQIITLPQEPDANFSKIQELIFEHLDRDCLIVDKQIRLTGLRNLVKHLRLSKSLSEADLLTTKEVLTDFDLDKDNPIRHYKRVIEEYSKELKYPLVVKFVSKKEDSRTLHGRFIHSGDKSWSLGPGLNILHTKEDIFNELSPEAEDTKSTKKRHFGLFSNGLTLIAVMQLLSSENMLPGRGPFQGF